MSSRRKTALAARRHGADQDAKTRMTRNAPSAWSLTPSCANCVAVKHRAARSDRLPGHRRPGALDLIEPGTPPVHPLIPGPVHAAASGRTRPTIRQPTIHHRSVHRTEPDSERTRRPSTSASRCGKNMLQRDFEIADHQAHFASRSGGQADAADPRQPGARSAPDRPASTANASANAKPTLTQTMSLTQSIARSPATTSGE